MYGINFEFITLCQFYGRAIIFGSAIITPVPFKRIAAMKLCVIPARGGSKRLPRKNIKLFYGQPIIAYSIKAALASGCFDQVIVSTDDDEIAEIAKQYGAEVPFMRPAVLSDDFTGTIPIINHSIEWFAEHQQKPDLVCCLYATAPFVTAQALQQAYVLMLQESADFCFTVTSFPSPIQRAVKIAKNGRLEMFHPEFFEYRSQDLDEAYHDAGQFYWGKADAFLQNKPLYSEYAVPYILPRNLVQDIDTIEDWRQAELLFTLIQAEQV